MSCCNITPVTALNSTVNRTSGTQYVPLNFKSFSVLAVSGDVTVDGQAIPQGVSVSFDAAENEYFANGHTVNGSDYLLTIVTY